MTDPREKLSPRGARNDYETLICDESLPPSSGNWGGRTGLEKVLLVIVGVLVVTAIVLSTSLYASGYIDGEGRGTAQEVCTTKACAVAAGNILGKLDESVNPCDDMVRFSCGKWLDETEIPGSKSRWGGFDVLNNLIENTLHHVMESNETDAQAVDYMRDMYKGCMDEEAIEGKGYHWYLDNIVNNGYGKWPLVVGSSEFDQEKFDHATVAGVSTRQYGQSILIGANVGQDSKNSSRNVIYVDQPKGVLSRQMYINNTGQYDKYFNAYKDLTVGLAKLLIRENNGNMSANDSYLNLAFENMLKLETKIAKMSSPAEDRRNETKMYNPFTLKDLNEKYPNVGFKKFFEEMFARTDVSILGEDGNLSDTYTVIVYEPNYFEQLDEALNSDSDFDNETIANYMFLRVALGWLSHGPKEMDDLAFEFQKASYGTSFRKPRWQRCVGVASSDEQGFGMAAGHSYIKKTFDDESRDAAGSMVEDIRNAFKELLMESRWMNRATQLLANVKADAIVKEVGYPEWLPNEDALDKYFENAVPPNKDSHLLNVAKMTEWRVQWYLNKLDKATDRLEWTTNPAIVNAWYAPDRNTITFPAGILQGSFFNKDHPKYLNYGSIGVVIGHEITHGFDDQGRQFDKDGNANMWWDDETIKKFEEHAQCFIDMYQDYDTPELVPPMKPEEAHLNGINTQGENIADNGGLREGFRAYKKFLSREMDGETEQALPGLQKYTSDQMFFISFAQTWCEKITKESLLNQVLNNPHSPAKYRIIGPLSNSEDFVNAFECPTDSNMNRKDKCLLW